MSKKVKLSWLDPAILVLESALDNTEDLIELAEFSNEWRVGTAGSKDNPEIRITDIYDIHENEESHKSLLIYLEAAVDAYVRKYDNLDIHTMESFRIGRYKEGGFYKKHKDRGQGTYQRTISVLMYLNDNYEGGELYFNNQDIEYKPKTGDIVVFPSNFLYSHECKKITKGTKYVVITWLA